MSKMFVCNMDMLLLAVYLLNVEGQQNKSNDVFMATQWVVALITCLANSLCTLLGMVKR